MAVKSATGPQIGGVGLIVLCFLGSAALRATESGAAIAEEIGAMASGDPGTVQAPPSDGAPDALLAGVAMAVVLIWLMFALAAPIS